MRMRSGCGKKINNQRGAAMMEYSILIASIAVLCLSAIWALGQVMPVAVCGVMRQGQAALYYDPATHSCYQDLDHEASPYF